MLIKFIDITAVIPNETRAGAAVLSSQKLTNDSTTSKVDGM